MKINATQIAVRGQHLPAVAVRAALVSSWDGVVTRGFAAAGDAAATPSATNGTTGAVVTTSYKRTTQVLIPDSSPPV